MDVDVDVVDVVDVGVVDEVMEEVVEVGVVEEKEEEVDVEPWDCSPPPPPPALLSDPTQGMVKVVSTPPAEKVETDAHVVLEEAPPSAPEK